MLGQKTTTTASSSYQKVLSKLVADCKNESNESNRDKRIEILNDINSSF